MLKLLHNSGPRLNPITDQCFHLFYFYLKRVQRAFISVKMRFCGVQTVGGDTDVLFEVY